MYSLNKTSPSNQLDDLIGITEFCLTREAVVQTMGSLAVGRFLTILDMLAFAEFNESTLVAPAQVVLGAVAVSYAQEGQAIEFSREVFGPQVTYDGNPQLTDIFETDFEANKHITFANTAAMTYWLESDPMPNVHNSRPVMLLRNDNIQPAHMSLTLLHEIVHVWQCLRHNSQTDDLPMPLPSAELEAYDWQDKYEKGLIAAGILPEPIQSTYSHIINVIRRKLNGDTTNKYLATERLRHELAAKSLAGLVFVQQPSTSA